MEYIEYTKDEYEKSDRKEAVVYTSGLGGILNQVFQLVKLKIIQNN